MLSILALFFFIIILYVCSPIGFYFAISFCLSRIISLKYDSNKGYLFFIVSIFLPIIWIYLAQYQLEALCNNNQHITLYKVKNNITGFFDNRTPNVNLAGYEIFDKGFDFIEIPAKNEKANIYDRIKAEEGRIRVNYLISEHELSLSEPQLISSFFRIYSVDFLVKERNSTKPLGKLTDYLWGVAEKEQFPVLFQYLTNFYKSNFLSCGPGLSKGISPYFKDLTLQRSHEYRMRDAAFIEHILRANTK